MKSRLVFYLYFAVFALFLLPAISYAAPKIFYTDIVSGPNTGGENNNGAYLSIFGKDFENNINNVKVYVGNGEVARYIYLGSSLGRTDVQQLSVQLGPNISTGTIRVVVNGIESNTDHTFTVRAGNFYYVSLTGSDSTGQVNNINKPYRTPNYIRNLSAFGAGDFIIVRGGTYFLNDGTNNLYNSIWLTMYKSGSAGSPITFMGYPGETITAQADQPTELVQTSTIADREYWVIANFKFFINHTGGSVMQLGTVASACNAPAFYFRHGRIININIYGGVNAGTSGSNVIDVDHAEDVKLYGINIHDTEFVGTNGDGQPHSHLIYLGAAQSNIDVGWGEIKNIPSTRAAIQVHEDAFAGCYGTKSLTDIKIHDFIIDNIDSQAILLGGGTGDIWVYNNIIANVPIGSTAVYEDIIALRGDGGALNARLYNNTIYVNPYYTNQGWILGIGSVTDGYCPQQLTLYNNIFYVTEGQDRYYLAESACQGLSFVTSNNNIWYGSNAGLPSFAGVNDKSGFNPQFVSPAAGDFHLNTASPAKDTGSSAVAAVVTKDFDGNTRPMGAGYDIGAYEYAGQAVPILQFSSATYSVSEGAGTATISVTRTGSSSGAVSVSYATSNGTATAGSDYTAKSGTLSWAIGDVAAKTFTIAINDDAIDENDETINLTLSNAGGGAILGTQSTAMLTITDNDSTGGGGGGDTPPPSSSSGGDSGGGSGGGCGFVKDDNNGKGPRANGGAAAFAMMLILTLAGIAIARRASQLRNSASYRNTI